MAGRNGNYGGGGNFQRRPHMNSSNKDTDENITKRNLNEYVRALQAEKMAIDSEQNPLAENLIEQEIARAQAEGRIPRKDQKFVDIYHDKPAKINVRVKVPLHKNPKFNFVGKLLGPKGNTLKKLQEDTLCKMAILGRGSIKDPEKEEELRKSSEAKYAHLNDDLHVEISTQAPPAEAYARISYALAEIEKYLIPDGSDDISKSQLLEMGLYEERPPHPRGRPGPQSGGPNRRPLIQGGSASRPVGGMRPSSQRPATGPRGPPGKPNIMGMIERNRGPVNERYSGGYEDPYEEEESSYNNYSSAPPRSGFGGGNRFGAPEYDDYPDSSNDFAESQQWRPYKAAGGASMRSEQPRYRSAPYSRPGHKM